VVRTGVGTGRRPVVYFLTPDFDHPAGGVRVMYRHVDALNDAGVAAAVLHSRRGFRCTWFDSRSTVVASTQDIEVTPDDVLVVPEVLARIMPLLPPDLRHVLFDQSGHLLLTRDPDTIAAHIQSSTGLAGILTVSDHSLGLLRFVFPHVPVSRVRLSLDPSVFRLGAGGRQGILHLPRRGGSEAAVVLSMLRARGRLTGVPVQGLDGVSQATLASALRRTSIFLHLPYQEGFGLPAVEAMACGAYVIGYHGHGGREFFHDDFSTPVETGNLLALAQAIEHALDREAAQPGWLSLRGRAASDFVTGTYTPAQEVAQVVEYYSRLVG
jgi:glycosyltransferase involved in cell wall biosynthesis